MRARAFLVSILVTTSFVPVATADPGVEEDILEVSERLARAPADVGALLQRAELYARAGAIEQALDDVRVADAIAPDDPRVETQRAAILHRLGREHEALAEVDAALERPPTFDALVLRARILVELDRLPEAAADYSAALALGDQVAVYLERGRLLERLDRVDDALRGYEQGLLVSDGAIVLREAAIALYLQHGDGARALAHADAVLADHRGARARWLLMRADALEVLGRDGEARRARLDALREVERRLSRRATPALHVARGRALLALDRAEDALAEARVARALAPHFGDAADLEVAVRRILRGGAR